MINSSSELITGTEAWDHLTAWLPRMLEKLFNSDVFHIGARPPDDQRGVYLFSEGERHLYVGRTSITARSRIKDNPPGTSFRRRFDQHIQNGCDPGASPFANRLMLEYAFERNLTVPGAWWSDRQTSAADIYALYKNAKARIGAMECRVVPFEDDVLGVRSTVAEMYVHVQLGTLYNDFSTS